jgi:hypothetical protein
MSYSLELDDDEIGIVVTAVRIQQERLHDAVMGKLIHDPNLGEVPLKDATEMLRRHEELLKRLPERGLNF